ncbi:hypothetical protein PV04_06677 [Phialophora macrospora]|uniref:Uncharacterized protein n=1 Tax=Phialophora macrospora TaxID=1851006 RepID=A0A0D2G602_9EURO|nr:hypothetical protein PV04_06677 [Phialophora macrospora]
MLDTAACSALPLPSTRSGHFECLNSRDAATTVSVTSINLANPSPPSTTSVDPAAVTLQSSHCRHPAQRLLPRSGPPIAASNTQVQLHAPGGGGLYTTLLFASDLALLSTRSALTWLWSQARTLRCASTKLPNRPLLSSSNCCLPFLRSCEP